MRLGMHMEGGRMLHSSISEAVILSHSCVQAFISSPMQLCKWDEKEILSIKHTLSEVPEFTLIIHGPYVYNLASLDETKFKQALGMLKKMLEFCSAASIPYLVNHVGVGNIDRLYKVCDYVLSKGYKTKFVLENDTGSKTGTKVGSLSNIRKLQKSFPELGFCFDTAHAYADGFDVENQGVRLVELMKPDIIHLNEPDLKVEFGGHLDRHNSVFGSGKIGLEALYRIAKAANSFLVVESERSNSLKSISLLKERDNV